MSSLPQAIGVYISSSSIKNSFSRVREKAGMRGVQIDEMHLNAAFGIESACTQYDFSLLNLPHPNPLPLAGEGVLSEIPLVKLP